MYATVALILLFATDPQQELKHDVPQPRQQGTPTDPLFDKAYVATDEPAFVLSVIESTRQGEVDARIAAEELGKPELRDAAKRIGRLNGSTRARLEVLAKSKGWRLPEKNPDRASHVAGGQRFTHRCEFHHAADFVSREHRCPVPRAAEWQRRPGSQA